GSGGRVGRVGQMGAFVLDAWLQDLRYAVRTLGRNPVFALTAAASLAVGIGANTTIFTIARAMLFKAPSGVTDSGRLVYIGRSRNGQGFDTNSYPNFLDIRSRSTVFTDVYADRIEPQAVSLGIAGGAERVFGEVVTTNYFSVLGARPVLGRLFAPSDGHEPGTTPFVVLSHRFWTRRFNADVSLV